MKRARQLYVWKFLDELARRRAFAGGPMVTVSFAARRRKIPLSFLEALAAKLKHCDHLIARRGKVGGGYAFAGAPGSLSYYDVGEELMEALMLADCARSDTAPACIGCPKGKRCRVRRVMRDIVQAVEQVLKAHHYT